MYYLIPSAVTIVAYVAALIFMARCDDGYQSSSGIGAGIGMMFELMFGGILLALATVVSLAAWCVYFAFT